MKVVLLAPHVGDPGSFYEIFSDCLGVAARQLGVDLEVVGGTKQRQPMLALGRKIVEGSSRPDYLLLVNYMNVGQDLLPLSAAAGVGTFFVVEGMGKGRASPRRTGARRTGDTWARSCRTTPRRDTLSRRS